jgi:hypothetical protein
MIAIHGSATFRDGSGEICHPPPMPDHFRQISLLFRQIGFAIFQSSFLFSSSKTIHCLFFNLSGFDVFRTDSILHEFSRLTRTSPAPFPKIIFRNQNLFHPASPQKPFRIFSDHIRTLEIESADSQFSSSWNPIHSTSLSRLRFNKQINLIDLLSVTVLRLTNGARPTSLA